MSTITSRPRDANYGLRAKPSDSDEEPFQELEVGCDALPLQGVAPLSSRKAEHLKDEGKESDVSNGHRPIRRSQEMYFLPLEEEKEGPNPAHTVSSRERGDSQEFRRAAFPAQKDVLERSTPGVLRKESLQNLAPQQENSEPSCFARHKCKLIGAATFGIIGLIGAILAVAYLYFPGAKQAIEGAIKEQPGAAALVTLGMGSAFGVMAFIIAKKGVDSKTAESQDEQGLQAADAVQQRNHPDPLESLDKRAQALNEKLQTLQETSGYKWSPLTKIQDYLYTIGPDFSKEKAEAVNEAITLLTVRPAYSRYGRLTELEISIQNVYELQDDLLQSFLRDDNGDKRARLEEELETARAKVQEIKAPLEQALTESLNALLTEIKNAINAEKDDRNKQHLAQSKKDLGRVIAYRDNYRELEEERETLREERFRLMVTNSANTKRFKAIDDLLHSR